MKEHFLDVITNHYADFNGRARRKEYWMFTLFNAITNLVLYILAIVGTVSTGSETVATIFSAIYGIYCLAIILPSLSIIVRRLHDIGKSCWAWFMCLIPLAGPIIVLVYMCTDSQPGSNEYGPNPKGIN